MYVEYLLSMRKMIDTRQVVHPVEQKFIENVRQPK